MTITALVSPLTAKPPISSHAAVQAGASGAADAATDSDFGALLANHIRSGAVSVEAAPDLPAESAQAISDEASEEGSPSAAPDATVLLSAPLQTAPQVAAVALPLAAAALQLATPPGAAALPPKPATQRSEFVDLVAESSEDVALPQSGKVAADIAVSGKMLPLTATEIAIAGKNDVGLAKPHVVDLTPQVRPESLIASPVPHASLPSLAPLPSLAVEPKVGAPGWDGALGQRVLWMATKQQQVAEIRLNPPNLGPLEVRLTITNDQASAQFVSHHPAVREAIEAALPRLREMLADSGINLGNVQVGSESFAQSRAFDQGDARSSGQGGFLTAQVSDPQHVSAGLLALPREGMVDTFA